MKRHAIIILVLVLAAAAINVPAALLLMPNTANPLGGVGRKLVSQNPATNTRWPFATPHQTPWPPVNSRQSGYWFGASATYAYGGDNQTGRFQEQVVFAGWPLSTIAHVQYWWPWDDPVFNLPNSSTVAQRGIVVLPAGLVLNPIIIGGGLWIFLFGLPIAWRRVRGRLRRKHGACPVCGYDLRGTNTSLCPECGTESPSSNVPQVTAG